jgi:hypothetical protein
MLFGVHMSGIISKGINDVPVCSYFDLSQHVSLLQLNTSIVLQLNNSISMEILLFESCIFFALRVLKLLLLLVIVINPTETCRFPMKRWNVYMNGVMLPR